MGSELNLISRTRLVINCKSGMRKFYDSAIFEDTIIKINELASVATSELHMNYLKKHSYSRYLTSIKLLNNIRTCDKKFGNEGRYHDKVDISFSSSYVGGKYVTIDIFSPLIGDKIPLLTPLGSKTSDSVRGSLILMSFMKISFLEDMLDRSPMSLYDITNHCMDNDSAESKLYKSISLFHVIRALDYARSECSVDELKCVVMSIKYSSPYIYSFLGFKDNMRYRDITSAIHDKYFELLNMTNNYYSRCIGI